MGKLLGRAWRRLWGSGLVMMAVMWCMLGWVSYYCLSQIIASPWQHRIYDFRHLDIGTLRLFLLTVSRHTAFPLLVILFVTRLCLNPVIDAFVFGRLGRNSQVLWRPFCRLYLILYLGFIFLAWVFYLSISALLQLLTMHPFVFLLTVLGLFFCFSLWLALYKARLAVAAHSWPAPLTWLQVALARLMIIGLVVIISFWLQRWATALGGWKLVLLLFLAELLAVGARLWQSSCAIEAAVAKAGWSNFGG